jgi:hypothetical protein
MVPEPFRILSTAKLTSIGFDQRWAVEIEA